MCSIRNIRLLNLIFSFAKFIICIYLFAVGIQFAQTVYIHQAFGLSFISFGAGLIVLSFLSGFVIPVHMYSVKRHNRFLLMVSFFVDLLVMSVVIVVGLDVQSYTGSNFSVALKEDCLRNVRTSHTLSECLPYFQDDRTAGYRLVWEALYRDRNNTASFQVLSTLQGRKCCGFFTPFNCIVNEDPFPTDRPLTGIPRSLSKQRVFCGPVDPYYPPQYDCTEYSDPAAIPPKIGGCTYDMGLGFCITNKLKGAAGQPGSGYGLSCFRFFPWLCV